MLRLLGLTLIFVAGAATAAHADGRFERPATGTIETALHQSVALAGKRQLALDPRVGILQLQISGALAFAQPSLSAAVHGAPWPSPAYVHPLAYGGGYPGERRTVPASLLELDRA